MWKAEAYILDSKITQVEKLLLVTFVGTGFEG